jgi:anti-anti-sigma factor
MDDVNILHFTRQETAGGVRLIGEGEIDAHSVTLLRAAATGAMAAGAGRIELDLDEITFIDSSGLRALAEARSQARRRGVQLWITQVSPPVRRILEISGMLDELTGAPQR